MLPYCLSEYVHRVYLNEAYDRKGWSIPQGRSERVRLAS
jgi:hypothetical protein